MNNGGHGERAMEECRCPCIDIDENGDCKGCGYGPEDRRMMLEREIQATALAFLHRVKLCFGATLPKLHPLRNDGTNAYGVLAMLAQYSDPRNGKHVGADNEGVSFEEVMQLFAGYITEETMIIEAGGPRPELGDDSRFLKELKEKPDTETQPVPVTDKRNFALRVAQELATRHGIELSEERATELIDAELAKSRTPQN